MLRLVALCLLSVALSACAITGGLGGAPRPAESEYFTSKGGGLTLNLEDNKAGQVCRYSLLLTMRRAINAPLYLRTSFDNPAHPDKPLVVESEVHPGVADVHISSREVRGLQRGRIYKVQVLVFDSPERSRPIGEHVQLLKSSVEIP